LIVVIIKFFEASNGPLFLLYVVFSLMNTSKLIAYMFHLKTVTIVWLSLSLHVYFSREMILSIYIYIYYLIYIYIYIYILKKGSQLKYRYLHNKKIYPSGNPQGGRKPCKISSV
jgi:hypothetical protein